ncbi:MAG: cohesin domain-containing protein [Caldilineales bacterium]
MRFPSFPSFPHFLHVPLVAIVLVLAVMMPLVASAQGGTTVTLQQPVAVEGGDTLTTEVTVAGVDGLLGFQFDVNFDPAVLAVDSIELGPFLASTGRAPQPLGPDESKAADGVVVYGGFTLGTADVPGASGDGVLATITWRSLQDSPTEVNLSGIQLAGAGAQPLPVDPASETPVTFQSAGGGSGGESGSGVPQLLGLPWYVWLAILLVGMAVVALVIMQRRQSK